MKKSEILEAEKKLNEEFSKTPVTEEQKRVAEKYKDAMDLRFTPDGRSYSIWHDGLIQSTRTFIQIEPGLLDNKFNCEIDGKKVTLCTKPQNKLQEIILENYHYLKKQIYFGDSKRSVQCFLANRNQLEQLIISYHFKTQINPEWEDIETDFSPLSYKQQRVYWEFKHYKSDLIFSVNGERSFIYTYNKKICEIIVKAEAIKKGLDMDECYDFVNGYFIIVIDDTDIHYKSIQKALEEALEEIDSF